MRQDERACGPAWHTLWFIAMTLVLSSAPAWGQTTFAWPDTAVDASRYTTVEECEAAVYRVRQSTVSHERMISGVWLDTMPPDPQERLRPPRAQVVETARRCLARIPADSVPLTYFEILAPLYLVAGWDAQASALAERRVAAVAPGAESELAAVIDSVARIYGQGTPPRLALAEDIVNMHSPRVSDRTKRLRLYLNLLVRTALELRTAVEWRTDTARVARVMRRAVAIADSLTDREREALKYEKLSGGVELAIDEAGNLQDQLYAVLNDLLGKDVLLDSLRRSTAAFVALKRENWVRVTRRAPTEFEMPIGEPVPAIRADFLLGRGSSSGPIPTPGRVSLLAFIHLPADNSYYVEHLFVLRRLARRFPQLEITVVAQSHGYFMHLKDAITPAREAELTKQWLESYGLDAALAMTSTDYWRLPEPDRRRINSAVANRTNYTFGGSWGGDSPQGATYLVDAEGLLVDISGQALSRLRSKEFGDMIEVLLARGSAGVASPR